MLDKMFRQTEKEGFKESLDNSIKSVDNPYLLFGARYKDILFDENRSVKRPIPVVSVDESIIATKGNIITLLGQSKAGKSAVVSSWIAGMINPNPINIDTLGFKIQPNIDTKAVLHFDTEQSYYDWHRSQQNILQRSKLPHKPDEYDSVFLRTRDVAERITIIKETCKVMCNKFGGIHAIFIDGIADLVSSVNDEKECYRVIDLLLGLSDIYKTIVIVVIHLNPGALEKARGHLGSQLNRKSESTLSVTKEKGSDISKVKPFLLRNAGASETPKIEFHWDKEKKHHVFLNYDYSEGSKEPTKKEVGIETIINILKENSSLSHTKLRDLIIESTGVSVSTAKRAIADATDKGTIQKNEKEYSLMVEDNDGKDDDEIDDDDVPF
jgi:hypothetical protein